MTQSIYNLSISNGNSISTGSLLIRCSPEKSQFNLIKNDKFYFFLTIQNKCLNIPNNQSTFYRCQRTMKVKMMLIVIFLNCLAIVCSSPIEVKRKIIGSVEVDSITQFPYQTMIFARYDSSTMFSSGAILSSKYIVTCAHGLVGSSSSSIFYGSEKISNLDFSKNQVVLSENYRIHPNYSTYFNDIALIQMNFAIEFSGELKNISKISSFNHVDLQIQSKALSCQILSNQAICTLRNG